MGKIYHLSHTDLDGYGCQLITKKIFNDIEFFNSNYGKEIDQKVNLISEFAKKGDKILITDLNLNDSQAEFLDKKSKENGFDILVLDHHKSGEETAKKYSWYFLDTSRCATKITFDYFLKENNIKELEFFVECVNAYDIWLKENYNKFEIGKVLARYITNSNEINRIMFSKENFEYMMFLLQNSIKHLMEKNSFIKLDDMLHFLKKDFFRKDQEDTLENMVAEFIVGLLEKHKDEMSFFYEDKKAILTYGIGNTSIIANKFLEENEDFAFFLDINPKKTISLRANNNFDVSLFAKKFFNGGGHPNASGGRFDDFEESFIYEDVKNQVVNYINQ